MMPLKSKWQKLPLALKVSAAYAICSTLQRCLSFITLPIFTRLLTTEQYGQVTIYSSWSSILSIFLTLNLAFGSFSTAMIKFENDRNGYISSIECLCLVFSTAFLLLYLPLQDWWNRLFKLPTYIICLMIAEIISTNSLLFWNGKKRFEYKYVGVIAITLLISIITPLIQYIFVINSNDRGYARILGGAVVNIIVGTVFFIHNVLAGKKVFDKKYWIYALSFNIPLLAYYLSQFIFNQSDRIMINHMIGTDKAGIYGVAYSLATVLTFVLSAINSSYVPWFYRKIKDGKAEDNQTIANKISVLMALLLSSVIWFAPEIIKIMAGEKYSEAIYIVMPVTISILLLFYTQLFGNVEFYYEEKMKLIWASIGAALVNIFLNYIFIQKYGFIAAAYTTLLSYLIFCYSNYLAMKKILTDRDLDDIAYDYRTLIAIFIIFCVCSVLGVLLYQVLSVRLSIAMVVFAYFIKERKFFLTFEPKGSAMI